MHVVGLSIGDASCLSSVCPIVESADILVGGERLLSLFPGHKGVKIPIKHPIDDCLSTVKEAAKAGKRVVVLADGDPLFFGIGRRLTDLLGREGVCVHPAVTALQAAAAKAAICWEGIKTVSLHGRRDILPLLRALAFYDLVGLYTDEKSNPAWIAKRLYNSGVDTFSMTVFENLGQDGERHATFDIRDAAGREFSPLSFVIFQRVRKPGVPLRLGIDDDALVHENGLITKKEVRAVGLSLLGIEPQHLVWDLGAGCGSVGIEASFLARRGMVLAVEQDEARFQMIRENRKRTGAYMLEPVFGKMPQVLRELPAPDRIFMGGGLGKDVSVLEEAAKYLKPGGRIVIHSVLLGSMNRACGFFENVSWPWNITQVAVSCAGNLAGDKYLKARNPVFIIAAEKPEG